MASRPPVDWVDLTRESCSTTQQQPISSGFQELVRQLQQARAPLGNMPLVDNLQASAAGGQPQTLDARQEYMYEYLRSLQYGAAPSFPPAPMPATIQRTTAALPAVQAPYYNNTMLIAAAQPLPAQHMPSAATAPVQRMNKAAVVPVQHVNSAAAAPVQKVDTGSKTKKRKATAQQQTAFPLVDAWLYGSQYLEIRGKTLKAYDCGGEIFRAQRGRSVEDLMAKFEAFLAAHPDGNYFDD